MENCQSGSNPLGPTRSPSLDHQGLEAGKWRRGGMNCGGCAILVARIEICHFMENCQSGSNPLGPTRSPSLAHQGARSWKMAERGGFEPPVARATLDFESSTFDRSDTSPKSWSALHQSGSNPVVLTPFSQIFLSATTRSRIGKWRRRRD